MRRERERGRLEKILEGEGVAEEERKKAAAGARWWRMNSRPTSGVQSR